MAEVVYGSSEVDLKEEKQKKHDGEAPNQERGGGEESNEGRSGM